MKQAVILPKPHWLFDAEQDRKIAFAIVLSSTVSVDDSLTTIYALLNKHNIAIASSNTFSNNKGVEVVISTKITLAWMLFQQLLETIDIQRNDIAILPVAARKKKLLVCDMDSTIVATETLDDIAIRVGVGEQVKAITDSAMQGKLDFRKALDQRVGLLAGVEEHVLTDILQDIEFSPGAEKLIKLAQLHGIRTVLVSGGFKSIVKTVADSLGFDRYVCNELEIVNEKLTGGVVEPVVDSETKLNVLLEECRDLQIDPEQACCIGDGANDIPMLQAAGLGISYQGKPLVRAATPYQINAGNLEFVASIMGFDING